MTEPTYELWIARIIDESDEFTKTIAPDTVDEKVPGCPEWTVRDLVGHLGRVQRFWAATVRVGKDVDPTSFDDAVPLPDATDLASWMLGSTGELVAALRETSPTTPAWVWWRDDRTVGAIARHQVQEAAVHRWDAQSAIGTPAPLALEIANDGLDEFLGIARQLREPAPIAFRASDTGSMFSAGAEPVVTVSATASDLVLLLHGRITPDAVTVDGDGSVLDAFLVPIE